MRPRFSFLILAAILFAAPAFGQTDCGWNPDANGDNEVGVVDLLALLGVFEEQDSDGDGIWDSQDDCVGVEDPCGVCNGTGTDDDLDGLCDDLDDCAGEYDECGVCNGPGPDVPVIESIEAFYDSVFIPQIEEWYVFEIGADTTFSYVCPTPGCTDPDAGNFNPEAVVEDGSCVYGPEECGGAMSVTFDGHAYDLVAIGSQCWFAENLRTEHYANGDAIPGNLSDSQWTSTSSGAQAIYDNDDANLATYGRLYNWYAVDDSRGLCPSGWHVPMDDEWTLLTDELGGSSVAGAAMKSSPSDSPSWDGTNTSGFSALPGGWRDSNDGTFSDVGDYGYWWSASPGGAFYAWLRGLNSDNDDVFRYIGDLRNGNSVRCLRDE